ncbi:MAG: glutathione metabolism protein [Kordiimonadales bacterium]|nr:MAG: glutathione metabolism protein [Kordiimonadales bacterium]
MTVTLITAGFIGLLMLVTSIQTGRMRGKTETSLGEGNDINLLGAIRAHGNLTEYAPMVLILIGGMEYLKANATLVMVMGIVFVVARISHAFGLINHPEGTVVFRAIGALGTMIVLAVSAVTVILLAYGIL